MTRSEKIAVFTLLLGSLQGIGLQERVSCEPYRSGSVASGLLNASETTASAAYNPLSGPNYPVVQASYFTDDYGNILMIVNVLGEVNKPGQIVVRENADFATIFALAGGVKSNANLKKVVLSRSEPDNSGRQAYRLNLKRYYERGDRFGFMALKPNDTIIIPDKKGLTLESVTRLASLGLFF